MFQNHETQSKFAINKKVKPLNELTTFWNCFTIVCYGYFGDSSSARYTYATAYNAHYLFSYLLWTRTSKAIDYISQLQLKVFYYPLLMSILCSLILMKYQGSTCVRYRHISYPYINTCIWSIFCIRVLLTEWIKIHSLQTKKLDRWGCGVAVKVLEGKHKMEQLSMYDYRLQVNIL